MFKKFIAILICAVFLVEQTGFAQVAPQMPVPQYLQGLLMADKFRPMHLRSVAIDGDRTLKVLLERGDEKKLKEQQVEQTTAKLLEYFQVGLALPNSTFWVNLRPDAFDAIIDPQLEKTDLGRVLLEADLQLKKDMAALTDPNTPQGRQYWDKLYARAEALFAGEEAEIPTYNRPWIVPGEIIIGAGDNGAAYVYKATLKVLLESDALVGSISGPQVVFSDPRLKELNEYSAQLIKQLILPQLTRQINSNRKYAQLRQVYYSLILAQWFKQRSNGQTATKDLAELSSKEPWSKDTYFKEYQRSFQQGEYSRQEAVPGPSGLTVRRYFSGGFKMDTLFDGGKAAAAVVTVVPLARSVPGGISAVVFSAGQINVKAVSEIVVPAVAQNNDGGKDSDAEELLALLGDPDLSVKDIVRQMRKRGVDEQQLLEVSRALAQRGSLIADASRIAAALSLASALVMVSGHTHAVPVFIVSALAYMLCLPAGTYYKDLRVRLEQVLNSAEYLADKDGGSWKELTKWVLDNETALEQEFRNDPQRVVQMVEDQIFALNLDNENLKQAISFLDGHIFAMQFTGEKQAAAKEIDFSRGPAWFSSWVRSLMAVFSTSAKYRAYELVLATIRENTWGVGRDGGEAALAADMRSRLADIDKREKMIRSLERSHNPVDWAEREIQVNIKKLDYGVLGKDALELRSSLDRPAAAIADTVAIIAWQLFDQEEQIEQLRHRPAVGAVDAAYQQAVLARDKLHIELIEQMRDLDHALRDGGRDDRRMRSVLFAWVNEFTTVEKRLKAMVEDESLQQKLLAQIAAQYDVTDPHKDFTLNITNETTGQLYLSRTEEEIIANADAYVQTALINMAQDEAVKYAIRDRAKVLLRLIDKKAGQKEVFSKEAAVLIDRINGVLGLGIKGPEDVAAILRAEGVLDDLSSSVVADAKKLTVSFYSPMHMGSRQRLAARSRNALLLGSVSSTVAAFLTGRPGFYVLSPILLALALVPWLRNERSARILTSDQKAVLETVRLLEKQVRASKDGGQVKDSELGRAVLNAVLGLSELTTGLVLLVLVAPQLAGIAGGVVFAAAIGSGVIVCLLGIDALLNVVRERPIENNDNDKDDGVLVYPFNQALQRLRSGSEQERSQGLILLEQTVAQQEKALDPLMRVFARDLQDRLNGDPQFTMFLKRRDFASARHSIVRYLDIRSGNKPVAVRQYARRFDHVRPGDLLFEFSFKGLPSWKIFADVIDTATIEQGIIKKVRVAVAEDAGFDGGKQMQTTIDDFRGMAPSTVTLNARISAGQPFYYLSRLFIKRAASERVASDRLAMFVGQARPQAQAFDEVASIAKGDLVYLQDGRFGVVDLYNAQEQRLIFDVLGEDYSGSGVKILISDPVMIKNARFITAGQVFSRGMDYCMAKVQLMLKHIEKLERTADGATRSAAARRSVKFYAQKFNQFRSAARNLDGGQLPEGLSAGLFETLESDVLFRLDFHDTAVQRFLGWMDAESFEQQLDLREGSQVVLDATKAVNEPLPYAQAVEMARSGRYFVYAYRVDSLVESDILYILYPCDEEYDRCLASSAARKGDGGSVDPAFLVERLDNAKRDLLRLEQELAIIPDSDHSPLARKIQIGRLNTAVYEAYGKILNVIEQVEEFSASVDPQAAREARSLRSMAAYVVVDLLHLSRVRMELEIQKQEKPVTATRMIEQELEPVRSALAMCRSALFDCLEQVRNAAQGKDFAAGNTLAESFPTIAAMVEADMKEIEETIARMQEEKILLAPWKQGVYDKMIQRQKRLLDKKRDILDKDGGSYIEQRDALIKKIALQVRHVDEPAVMRSAQDFILLETGAKANFNPGYDSAKALTPAEAFNKLARLRKASLFSLVAYSPQEIFMPLAQVEAGIRDGLLQLVEYQQIPFAGESANGELTVDVFFTPLGWKDYFTRDGGQAEVAKVYAVLQAVLDQGQHKEVVGAHKDHAEELKAAVQLFEHEGVPQDVDLQRWIGLAAHFATADMYEGCVVSSIDMLVSLARLAHSRQERVDNGSELIRQVLDTFTSVVGSGRTESVRRAALKAHDQVRSLQKDGGKLSTAKPGIAVEKSEVGGIDLRSLPLNQVTMSGVAAVAVGTMTLAELDTQWAAIVKQMQCGPMPYAALKAHVRQCSGRQETAGHLQEVSACVMKILEMEEDAAVSTVAELKEVLCCLS